MYMLHLGQCGELKGKSFSILNCLPSFILPPLNTIIGGDFNCVLSPANITGSFQPSRALSEIVKRLALVDTWTQDPLRPTYTHHHPTGATRIDRLYVSQDLVQRKSGIEIIPAPFTDHHAVCSA